VEHLEVVLKLFDSWEDDALVLDKAAAVFADRTKVHRIRHAGAFYTVDGPLNAPRSPQGRPVLFQPIASAGKHADVVLVGFDDLTPTGRARVPDAKLLAEVSIDLGGDCAAIAEKLTSAYGDGLCDGFLFAPMDPPTDLALLTDQLVPRLRSDGPAGSASSAGDFRTRLGLARPASRYAGQIGP